MKLSQSNALERLYRRYVPPEHLVTPELAQFLAEISQEIRRQVGLIISRKGDIEYVIVGDSNGIFLPELGRIRAGKGRFRGIRLVHTHLRGEPLATDDFTDLSLLSLDMIAAIDARRNQNPLTIEAAYLLPVNPEGRQWELLGPAPVHSLELDFDHFIHELEGEFTKKAPVPMGVNDDGDRSILVFLDDGRYEDPGWELEELKELALSAGLRVVESVTQKRRADRKHFIGKGRLTDLVIRAMQLEVELLVFCPDLSPAQVKSIGDMASLRVIDRTQLILDIFAQRARSRDGRIQVELAQLRYLLPRLIGAGKAMSRLMGGIGGRGPGETKLEMDRRRISQRITRLEKELNLLAARRGERRKRRERNQVPVVSIVGYTNAGKSTLLNTLTDANALAENKLFATLDPYSKRLRFPRDREIILTDTVGFIRDLPRDLKAAFKATLEELETADLLLHVVDASSPRAEQQLAAVEDLLQELDLAWIPRITVFNKIDQMTEPEMAENLAVRYGGFAISALQKKTLKPLVTKIESWIWRPGDELNQPAGGNLDEEELRP